MGIKTNKLEVTGGITLNGVSIFDKIYPIGSLYLSVTNTNPGTLFGGTWQQLKDRFLLGAGDSYTGGATGGSKDAVVVSHNHDKGTMRIVGELSGGYGGYITNGKWESGCIYTHSQDGEQSAGGRGQQRYHIGIDTNRRNSWTGNTSTVGESGTDKNMPPYLVVYMWKRTA